MKPNRIKSCFASYLKSLCIISVTELRTICPIKLGIEHPLVYKLKSWTRIEYYTLLIT